VLVIGGLQLLMLGVLGEYLWRTLDEARARPRYLLEASAGGGDRPGAAHHQGAANGAANGKVPLAAAIMVKD
jgi:hypothetical protein